MSSVRIDTPTVDGTAMQCEISASGDLERLFTDETFEAEYDVPIEDVPEGVLVIPVLAQVCPVAWTRGANVYVDAVDATFARAIEDVKASLLGMYDFLEGGGLYARRLVDVDPGFDGDGESALLFTGGVDSTCSYVRHREAKPRLVSVRGWTVTPDPRDDAKWDAVRSRVSRFADERDLGTGFVESNMLSVLDQPMLLAHFSRRVDGGWYSSVGHGLGLLGLCAPMAYARGIADVYVAATHWEGVDLEWGSRPDVDEYVRWSGTRCHHDAYERTRQERIDSIADYVREEAPDLSLQTCNVRFDGNCGECEKCYRTAVGLRLAGLDPADHGYPFADGDYREIRRAFERGEWLLGHDERHMWEDIRERVRETEATSTPERAFFAWLESADLESLVEASDPPLHHRLFRAGARNAPGAVYDAAYPALKAVKTGVERVRSS